MTNAEAAKILRDHNRWRRGEDEYCPVGVEPPHPPKKIGEAIDHAVKVLTAAPRKRRHRKIARVNR